MGALGYEREKLMHMAKTTLKLSKYKLNLKDECIICYGSVSGSKSAQVSLYPWNVDDSNVSISYDHFKHWHDFLPMLWNKREKFGSVFNLNFFS